MKHAIKLGESTYEVRRTGSVREIRHEDKWLSPDEFTDILFKAGKHEELWDLVQYGAQKFTGEDE